MELLKPNWSSERPSWEEIFRSCASIELMPLEVQSTVAIRVLDNLRVSHDNGGALLAAFRVGPDTAFDWYASRNRLLEWDILPSLLRRQEVRRALPELLIPVSVDNSECSTSCCITQSEGFRMESPFKFDGQLALSLFNGGAHSRSQGDGRAEKQLALSFCDELFEQRFSEVQLYFNFDPWTPWFHGIAWDWTAVLFDLRQRILWILAVTDTD